MKYFTLQLAAPEDTNGNPRRVFVTYTADATQKFVAIYDEGYLGDSAITNPEHRAAFAGIRFNITVKEYKGFLKIAADRGGS